MKNPQSSQLLSLLLFALGAVQGYSATVLGNLNEPASPGDIQVTVGGWRAIPFMTDDAAYQVTSVSALISANQNIPGTSDPSYDGLHFALFDNRDFATEGLGPGTSIGRLDRDASSSTLLEQRFTGTIMLQPQTSYWLLAAVDNGGPSLGFNWDTASTLDPDPGSAWLFGSDLVGAGSPTDGTNRDFISDNLGSGWALASGTFRGYFQVEAVVVPEPSSAILIGVGALALAGIRRRNKIVEQGRAGNA